MSESPRKILHIDMDAFFASVEQRDDPSLRGKPVAVGGGEKRGVVAAASYEARKFGVRSAMSGVVARRLCPELIFVPPRFEKYKEASARIHEVFHLVTDVVEPLSLDEAYLDVTVNKREEPSATRLARWIKDGIRESTGLTASAGVSFNKFLAKMASGRNKPDGLTVVRPEDADAFTATLKVKDFYGVGPVTAARMEAFGYVDGASLRAAGEEILVERFGRGGSWYWNLAWGRDDRPVESEWERKSVGAEETFADDLVDPAAKRAALFAICEDVSRRLEKAGFAGRTVTVKIRDASFRTLTRSRSFRSPLRLAEELCAVSEPLFVAGGGDAHPIRLLGVSLSNLGPPVPEPQLTFDALPPPVAPEDGAN